VSSAEVFAALAAPIVRSADALQAAWQRGAPAFLPIDALCPPLARLLDVRRVVGLRNSGHTVAKLLAPVAGALRVMNYTHPEYGVLLRRFIELTAADAMLLRGTEGEPVADARRAPQLCVFVGGAARAELSSAAQQGVLATLPSWPTQPDAASTARYIRAVLDGEQPVPQPLWQQVDLLLRALAAASPSNASRDGPLRASA
jgi:anthranilate phosphoribosyltransferase